MLKLVEILGLSNPVIGRKFTNFNSGLVMSYVLRVTRLDV